MPTERDRFESAVRTTSALAASLDPTPTWSVISDEDARTIADFGGMSMETLRGVEMLVLLASKENKGREEERTALWEALGDLVDNLADELRREVMEKDDVRLSVSRAVVLLGGPYAPYLDGWLYTDEEKARISQVATEDHDLHEVHGG